MLKRILVGLIVIGFLVPTISRAEYASGNDHKQKRRQYRQERKAENRTFRESIKDLPPEQRTQKNQERKEKRHAERMAHLKEKLSANKNLTDAQKESLINLYETQYKERSTYKANRLQEMTDFRTKRANDESLNRKQKKEDYQKKENTEYQEIRKQAKMERQAKKQELGLKGKKDKTSK